MGSDIKVGQLDEIVLYDGVCEFCNSSVNFIIEHERNSILKFSPLQSSLSTELSRLYGFDPKELNALVFIKNKKAYFKSDAILKLGAYLKLPWRIVTIFKLIPYSFSNFFYDIISSNRYNFFGKSDSCILPTPEIKTRFLDSI